MDPFNSEWNCISAQKSVRKQNLTPWDRGDIQPSLKEALELPSLILPERATVLVPGCGRVLVPSHVSQLTEINCKQYRDMMPYLLPRN